MSFERSVFCLSAEKIAELSEDITLHKATKSKYQSFLLAILAGASIAFAFSFYVTAVAALGPNVGKFVGGFCFALGLILVVLLGGELFTSSTLTIVAKVTKQITWRQLFKNWMIVYFGNLVGALFIVLLIMLARSYMNFGTDWGKVVLDTAAHKIHHVYESDGDLKYARGFIEALSLGILCNVMVCVAVWLSWGGKTMSDKILIIILPVAMFVASGYEHSIANMFMIPLGISIHNFAIPEMAVAFAPHYNDLTIFNFIFSNLIPVTIGNVIGGGLIIGWYNWFVSYRMHQNA